MRREQPGFGGTVAVLTPYRAQLSALRRAFNLQSEAEKARVDFGTVDGFQVRLEASGTWFCVGIFRTRMHVV